MQRHERESLLSVIAMTGVEKWKKKREEKEEKHRRRERLEKARRFEIISDRGAGRTGNSHAVSLCP